MKHFPVISSENLKNDSASSASGSATGVVAVARALQLLEAFGLDDPHLGLAELSRRAGLHKTTALRLARTLAAQQYLVQQADGTWRLGRAAGWLGACYQAAFRVQDVVEPVLRQLSMQSGESASFYVREGQHRSCLVRVDGPQAVRHHVRVGAAMPLDLGAPGRVILAFEGEPDEPYVSIRQRGFHISVGERDPQVASVAAPVFGLKWQVLGSICISGPAVRLQADKLQQLAPSLLSASMQLSRSLAGSSR